MPLTELRKTLGEITQGSFSWLRSLLKNWFEKGVLRLGRSWASLFQSPWMIYSKSKKPCLNLLGRAGYVSRKKRLTIFKKTLGR
jgi:hypothetical protein